MEIIFVCTGNTCRSPMAEGLMKKLLSNRGIDSIQVSSAGLAAYPGDEVSENSINAAKKYSVDISAHRSRRINEYMLESGIFVCMTASHAEALKPYLTENRLFILGNGIEDPYGGTQEVYDRCAEEINSTLPELLCRIISANTTVEPMKPEHISQIAEIESRCFSMPWTEKSLSDELGNENAHFLAAVFDGNIIGYVGVIEICGEADITNVAVLPEYRGRGIARRLLARLIEAGKERALATITLEVRVSNTPAINLYQSFDFKPVGRRKNFYSHPTEDADLMTRWMKGE